MADRTILVIHIAIASIVAVISGFLAALISGENKRAPLVLGFLLVAFGLLKAASPGRIFPFGITISLRQSYFL